MKLTNAKMGEITSKVEEGLVEFIKEGKYKQVLIACSNLGDYSFNNQLLILSQKINASHLEGYKSWQKFNRYVKKGAKAIKIFAPIIKTEEVEEEETGEIKKVTNVIGFNICQVFDLSDTDGTPLDVFKFDKNKIVAKKQEIINSLINLINQNGCTFEWTDLEDTGANCFGYFNKQTHQIKVRNDLCDLQTISTLIHECGHLLAHSSPREDFRGLNPIDCKMIKEVEAESIACIVCNYLGLDTNNFNFSYIAAWSDGEIKKFKNNLEIISKHSNTIINALNI